MAKTRREHLIGGCSMGKDWSKGQNKTSAKEKRGCTLSICKGDGHSWIPAANEPGKPNTTWTAAAPRFTQSLFSPSFLKVIYPSADPALAVESLFKRSQGTDTREPNNPRYWECGLLRSVHSCHYSVILWLFLHCKAVFTLARLHFVYL